MKFCVALMLLVLLPMVAHAAAPAPAPNAEDAKLNAFFARYLEAMFRDEPLAATWLGEHKYDDRLDDLSKAARAARLERDRKTLAELAKAVDYRALSRDGQIDYEILRQNLDYGIWLREHFRPFETDPRVYGDYLTESVYLLLTQSSLPRETNVRNAIARMGEIPKVVEVARETIRDAHRVKVETAIRQTEGAIGFYTDEVFALAGAPKGEGELGRRAAAIVEALGRHRAFLRDEVLPKANDDWRIGPELFREKVARELDAGLSADEVLAEAEREAARVESEMAVIARLMWAKAFPGEPVPPDDAEGRRAMVRRVLRRIGEDRSTAESVVSDVRESVAGIKDFIATRKILALPEPDQCRIVEMPEFMRGNSTAYLNPAPPLDPRGSSEYAVSPPPADWTAEQVESYFREYNRAMLRILTIHEAYPGHYVQLEYSNRCPSPIRKILSSGAFAEGWAVYTEGMMLDQGYGGGDPALRLQQLKFYLRAVVNAILDHHMHAGNMTDEQAKDLLMNRAFQTEGEALGKIVRAKQSSAQLSTYFVGRTAFARLRQAVQREQGEAFDLARFHEATLSHGTLPVKYLPELVRRSLAEPAR
jgi:uncharacterized protein (DUF885 family)